MKKDLQEILTILRKLFPLMSQRYGVATIDVFGSYIRNEQSSHSDLDLLVTFSKVPGLLKFLELKNYLSDHLNMDVDLVMKDSLKPEIGRNILKGSIPV